MIGAADTSSLPAVIAAWQALMITGGVLLAVAVLGTFLCGRRPHHGGASNG